MYFSFNNVPNYLIFFVSADKKCEKQSSGKMRKSTEAAVNTRSNGHASDTPNGRADDEGGGQSSPTRVSYAAAARKHSTSHSPNTIKTATTNSGSNKLS